MTQAQIDEINNLSIGDEISPPDDYVMVDGEKRASERFSLLK